MSHSVLFLIAVYMLRLLAVNLYCSGCLAIFALHLGNLSANLGLILAWILV